MNENMNPSEAIETLRALLVGVAGVQDSEIFIRRIRTLEIRSKNQELSALREKIETGLALRLAKAGSCVVASTGDLSQAGLKELLIRGRSLLRAAQQGPMKRIIPVEEVSPGLEFDGSFGDVPLDEKVSRILNMTSLTIKSSSRYPKDVKATYFEKEKEEWLWHKSAKRIMSHRNTWAQITARALHEKTQGSKGFEVMSLRTQYFDIDWSGVARGAAEGAIFLDQTRRLEPGRYPAIIDAQTMVPFVKLLGDALRGDRVLTGRSFLDVSDVGKNVFSEALSLVEDPERISRAGYRLWDAEGQPTRKQVFVDKGKLVSLAFDSSSGWSEGYGTNCQAIRPNFGAHPHPGFHSLSIPAESKDPVDLRCELDKGLWLQGLDSLSLLQQGTSEFVACFSGRWIEKGEPQEGLTRILVRGDLKSLFSKIVSVSRDLAWGEHFGSPSVLVSELDVIGAHLDG